MHKAPTVLRSVEAIVERLVTAYDPDRIILFGSHATGQATAGSDIDLLIVKDTPKRPIDRRVEVERLVADRHVPLDLLVYTPQEVLDLYAEGSPLIEEVVKSGWVLSMAMDEVIFLNSVYRGRYPTEEGLLPHGQPTREDAQRALQTATMVVEQVSVALAESP